MLIRENVPRDSVLRRIWVFPMPLQIHVRTENIWRFAEPLQCLLAKRCLRQCCRKDLEVPEPLQVLIRSENGSRKDLGGF